MEAAGFEQLLKSSMGLDVASIGSSAIARAVQQRMSACDLRSSDAYWECVRGSAIELQALIEAVVVPETWFFRDREAFVEMARVMRDQWLQPPEDRMLSLLSLPCSTGEEPYSMAMALLDAGVPAARFRVDAVDISARVLSLAVLAVYGRNSFRGQDLAFRRRHFEATPDGDRLNEAVKRQVRFQSGNLFAADFMPGAELYDVIFCRNVLIYFDRETQDRAMLVLQRLLRPNGLLFVAPAETGLISGYRFVSTCGPLAFAFRKATAEPRLRQFVAPAPQPPGRAAPPPVRRVPAAPAPPLVLPAATGTDLEEAAQLADQGHFVEAALRCDAHFRRHGPSPAALCLMGLVRDATGNHQDAEAYYRKALYLDPNHAEAQIHLALLMERQGNRSGARVLRDRARRLAQKRLTSHE